MEDGKKAVRYRLKYQNVWNGASKTVELCMLSENPWYFYAWEPRPAGVRRSFFVKCRDPKDPDSFYRFRTEQETSWICSPYVAAQHGSGMAQTMEMPVIERDEGWGWESLSGQVAVYEYLPMDLEQFWQQQNEATQEERLEKFRGQILLKLIEGVAHLHQARFLHRDIKPKNIMVNCRGYCREADWTFPELDVKLTDMDGAHDGRVGPPAFYVKSQFFQPDWPLQSSVWLDIYSLCMVAMWLYGGGRTDGAEYEFLRQMSRRPLAEQDLSAVTANAGIRLPVPFWKCLEPALDMVSRHLGENGDDAWTWGMEVLRRLRERLRAYYFGQEGWQPMELLRPRNRRPLWSAVLQIDRNYWPVLGQGRNYHALSIMDQAREEESAAGAEPSRICNQTNGESLSVYYWKSLVFEEKDREKLSSPPEIYLAYEDTGDLCGSFRQKAGIFGSVLRRNTFTNRLLAERTGLSTGAGAVLYEGKPLYILGAEHAFCETIRVRAVRFHEEGEIAPLPVYQGPGGRTGADVNLVFLMDASYDLRTPPPSVGLLRQIVGEARDGGDCRPRFYGLAVNQYGEPPRSFCRGDNKISPEELAKWYARAAAGRVSPGLRWDECIQSDNKSHAFDPGLPTLLIACLEHGPERVFNWVGKGRPSWECPALQWAADYLQVFLPLETERELRSWEPLMPQFAAAVKPGGACIVTPFARERTGYDSERRWLTALRHHRRRM